MASFDEFVVVVGAVMAMGHLPQFAKLYAKKNASDISVFTYLLFFFGHIVWLTYAFGQGDVALLVSNGVSLFGVSLILGLCVLYGGVKLRMPKVLVPRFAFPRLWRK